MFGRDTRFRLPVQLAWKSKGKKWLFTANYAYERGMNSMGKVGTELAKNPFGYSNLIESNQYGFTLAYKWSDRFQITGAYGGNSMSSRYDSSVRHRHGERWRFGSDQQLDDRPELQRRVH